LALALRHRAPGAKSFLWAVFHFVESIYLADQLQRRKITHLHNHFANSGATVGLLASNFLKLSWSLTLHGISETDYPAGLLLGDKVRHASFVACVSWFGQAQAMRISEARNWSKFFVSRCGLELAQVRRLRMMAPRRVDGASIICVGRLSPEKGHFGLVTAFEKLRARGVDAELMLIGDGPERAQIEKRVRGSSVAQGVTFLGRLSEATTLAKIAEADLLVLPSFMEGLPIVLMEAMALGIPVVAPRVAGVPELVQDGVEGLLFTPSDWSDLADKMETLLLDARLRSGLAAAASTKIAREFDIKVAIKPIAAALLKVSGSSLLTDPGRSVLNRIWRAE
jgi:glycosyltransferase involved in cell wall biosynthesis